MLDFFYRQNICPVWDISVSTIDKSNGYLLCSTSPNLYVQLPITIYVLSDNNFQFGEYLHLIYPNDIGVNDSTDTQRYASCLHLHG